MNKKAFTLIELLVVIAVIAVLMGILMPSLRMAREQARSLACSSNLKNLSIAWRLYADENDSKIVNGHTPQPNDWDKKNPAWIMMPNDPGNATIEQKIEYLKQGALWPYLKQEDVFRCPSDGRKSSPAHKAAFRSYGIPHGLNAGPNGSWEIKEVCKSLNDIKNPSRKYVFMPECDVRGWNWGSWVLNPVTGEWVDALAVWHRGRSTNFAFADGHVEKHSWASQGLVDWCRTALDDPDKFSFRRSPTSGGEDELGDWRWAIGGYAYKQLTSAPKTFGGNIE